MGGGLALGSDCQLGENVRTFGCHSAWRQVRDGGSEVLRDLWAGVCSFSWKWYDFALSSLGQLRPLILHLQSVNHHVRGTALLLFPLELTELSIN